MPPDPNPPERRVFHAGASMHDQLRHLFEGVSLITACATVIGWFASALPPLAALASILWMGFQWYHSAPMKEWREKRKERKTNEPESKTDGGGTVA